MSNTSSASAIAEQASAGLHRIWLSGLLAAGTWAAAALITTGLPDVVPWGSAGLFVAITGSVAVVFVALALGVYRLKWLTRTLLHYGPWFVAIGAWLALWELTTAKSGWLPKPFFSPPHGLLDVYVNDGPRLLICILYSLRLWGLGFVSGVAVGYVVGIALGWSERFSYWGMPVLKLIGPVPATAWIPCSFYFFPSTFDASVFIVALASGIPVAILAAAGVNAISRDYYDVGHILGANAWYLIRKVVIPASLPQVFVGLFMGLYYSFAALVVAEMLGAKYGLGWYIQFQMEYSAYASVYATLLIMAVLCAGLVKLLFVFRNRLLRWQKNFI